MREKILKPCKLNPGERAPILLAIIGGKWWYTFGHKCYVWDTRPVGPFDTEAEAQTTAQEASTREST